MKKVPKCKACKKEKVNCTCGRPENCKGCHKAKQDCDCGRPTVMTPDVLLKLEDAFMNAFTDEMACLYAGIGKTALYEYCIENPTFKERKEELKLKPNLKAQKTLVEDLNTTSGARWWAEKKMPEFMPKSKIELDTQTSAVEITDAVRKVTDSFEKQMKAILTAKVK